VSGAVQREARVARLVSWTPWPFENPSLIGHAAVAFSGGWVVSQIPVFRRGDGRLSAGVPNAAQLDGEGRVKLKPDGKRSYAAIISFETGAARTRWNSLVLDALAAGGITGAPGGGLYRLEPPPC
jgi:hypothetical protein